MTQQANSEAYEGLPGRALVPLSLCGAEIALRERMTMSKTKVSLGVTGRIVAVAATYSLPIAVLLYLVCINIDEFISFAQYEVDGNAYQRPIEAALEAVQEHQLVLHECHGQASCRARLVAIAAQGSKAFETIESVDSRLASRLQFTVPGLAARGRDHVRGTTVPDEWKVLVARAALVTASIPADLDELYVHVVGDLRTMITHVGDTSNLILDPDLDSYYLMDVTLLALPQTQDRLGKLAAFGYDALARGSLTARERTTLAVDAALLQEADVDRVVGSAKTATNEDAHFYGQSASLQANLAPAIAAYKAAAEHFGGLMNKIAEEEHPSVSAADFLAAGLTARSASFRTWDVAVGELDTLLGYRIDAYFRRLVWALVLAGLAVLVSSIVAFAVMRSITRPLVKLARSLGPGATLLGECVARIASAYQDKTTTTEQAEVICDELSAHADDMRSAVSELVALVAGRAPEQPSPTISGPSKPPLRIAS